MKPALQCSYAGCAEAARDGRLEPRAAQAFAAHVASCPSCTQEAVALEELAEALRIDEPEVNATRLRALRERVLAEAPARRKQGLRMGEIPLPLLAAAAVALVVSIVDLHAMMHNHGQPERELVVVNAGPGGARWSEHRKAGVEEIELRDGTLHVDVRRRADDPRVLVRVPDGEIQDLGTVFSVSVESAKTSRLSVDEGSVIFTRTGLPAMTLSAGMKWSAAPSSREAAVAVDAGRQLAPSALPPAAASATEHTPKHARTRARSTKQDRERDVDAQVDAAGAEDAAYLQLMALLREHRADEARLAATQYLRAFPQGFRRKEVAAVLTHAAH